MENGSVSIFKGKHRERLDARVRVLAGANDLKRLPRPLVDRFDFVWELGQPDPEEMAEIMAWKLDTWLRRKRQDTELVVKFVWYVRSRPLPEWPDEERERAKQLIRRFILLTEQKRSVRWYERLLRIAVAIARARLKPRVGVEDLLEAIKLACWNVPWTTIARLEEFVRRMREAGG